MRRFLSWLALLSFPSGFLFADPAPAATPSRPVITPPTYSDIAYGADPKQKFDVYLPEGAGPFPVVLFIHGGGWVAGDKVSGVSNYARRFTKYGAACVSIGYRLVADAQAEKISPPVVAVLADTRRALQFVRLHAAEYKLDPDRIVTDGISAGALSSLYLACEGEQANPQSPDPVERVSTRILGAGAAYAQTSIDPKNIQDWNPGVPWGYWAFEPDGTNCKQESFNRWLADRDKWLPWITKYSPEILMTRDAAPMYLSFGFPVPAPGSHPTLYQQVHSPLWGVGFAKVAQERGAVCYLQYPGHLPGKFDNKPDVFLLTTLGLWKEKP